MFHNVVLCGKWCCVLRVSSVFLLTHSYFIFSTCANGFCSTL